MKKSREFKEFNPRLVPLAGSNLIEASAGTGKTYSIAILVLRLILEQKLSVKEILMVTFTKAAVAELEERTRFFVRQAYKASRGAPIKDQTITGLVQEVIALSGEKQVQDMLREAVLFLDEISVLTIHSFCQQTLNEFAIETGQLFGADLLQDTSQALEEEINKFWRKHVTRIPPDLLILLIEAGLSKSAINPVLKGHLSGMKYMLYQDGEEYSFCEETYAGLLTSIRELTQKEGELRECLIQHVINDSDRLKEISERNAHARKSILGIIDSPEEFIKVISSNKSEYITKLYPDFKVECEECEAVLVERNSILGDVIRKLYCLAIKEAAIGLASFKSRNNQMSYDDLILKLHQSLVVQNNSRLEHGLQAKFKAVFIDEFQDTDRMQFEIFDRAFGGHTTLFYIGDPKQSIYAWRKADVFTYFKARGAVDNLYGMNYNFRSSASLIKAMNLFFKPEEHFDTFHFENSPDAIEYIGVESPPENTKGNLFYDAQVDTPISISSFENQEQICQAVAGQVIQLLSDQRYKIITDESERLVRPVDIGILVRGNKEGEAIKSALAKYGIPAVTIGDGKVLKSTEAKYLLYLLEAISDVTRSRINKALLSSFTGFNEEQILNLDDETAIEQFRKYKASWEKEGVYRALNDFIADYGVRSHLLQANTESGERIITNLYQMLELLHKVQTNKRLSLAELISWLKRGINGMATEGDEFEQRIENDEEAVKIATIHSSKGLEYSIILAPFLDLKAVTKHKTFSFRDPESGDYVSGEKSQLNEEQLAELTRQNEQENRRLIYVAITRAIYKCFLYKNNVKKSSLAAFVDALPSTPLIAINEGVELPEQYTYASGSDAQAEVPQSPVHFNILQQYWRRMSYTALNPDHEISLKNRSATYDDPYEQFIFKQLKKGAKTGNMLHQIFENIHFADQSKWRYVIDQAINHFAAGNKEPYSSMLQALAGNVLNTPIRLGADQILLSDISPDRRINEFEFDFAVPVFKTSELRALSDGTMEVSVKDLQEIEGMMNGKVDLFFEYHGKYYILDWKSNYLGDSLSDYSPDNLTLAMNENNYHLQYLIYTLAVKKYLESRIPGFDFESQFGGVIYLFLRGIRKGSATGIFTYKPSEEKIEALEKILFVKKLQEFV